MPYKYCHFSILRIYLIVTSVYCGKLVLAGISFPKYKINKYKNKEIALFFTRFFLNSNKNCSRGIFLENVLSIFFPPGQTLCIILRLTVNHFHEVPKKFFFSCFGWLLGCCYAVAR